MSVRGMLQKAGILTSGRDIKIMDGSLRVSGRVRTISATSVRVLVEDGSGNVLWATGTTVPSDGAAGYAKGCLFVDTDVAAGTTGLYVNVGTTAAANFDAVQDA